MKCVCSSVKEEIRFEASALHQVVEREADKCVDDGSGTVQVSVATSVHDLTSSPTDNPHHTDLAY